jgi:quinol monooxygenase YgiN
MTPPPNSPNAPVHVVAAITAAAGRRDALRDALAALVPATRAEPGCIDYTLFEARDLPGTFYMRECFVDAAALDAHMATAHFRSFAARLTELVDGAIVPTFLTPVA